MFQLFEELWFASDNSTVPIEYIGIRLMEVAKSTGNSREYVREHFKELITQGCVKMISETPLLFVFTEKGKNVKTLADVEAITSKVA